MTAIPKVLVLEEKEFPFWDDFVSNHPGSSIYHLSNWRHIVGSAFGKRWCVVAVLKAGRIRGGVPLVHMKSILFGNCLVSMPYVNYGGLLIEDENDIEPLLQGIQATRKQLKADHVELRHLSSLNISLPARFEKVSMWLSLPTTSDELLKSFKPKLRSQIRKGEKNGLVVRQGGGELLNDFYTVFTENMRDLGTPVYSKMFFQLILESFPKTSRLLVVYGQDAHPLACGFLLGYRDRLEIPWASSLRAFNYLQTNMFLYWNCLKFACEEGYKTFDFGRSTRDSSTYRFKEQWGACPINHYWHYQLSHEQSLPQLNPQNPKFRLAIAMWQRLPIPITKILGPIISKDIP